MAAAKASWSGSGNRDAAANAFSSALVMVR
jgi:hypothetical protein